MGQFYNIKPENKHMYKFKNQGCGVITFEHDSSPRAWKHYERVYGTTIALGKNWDRGISERKGVYSHTIRSRYLTGRGKAFRNIQYLPSKDQKNSYYKFGGDCDFNFNTEKTGAFERKINSFKNLSTNDRNNILAKLEYCSQMHHTLLNMSLMLTTGGMQQAKGKGKPLSGDRLDKWFKKLEVYYKNECAIRDITPLLHRKNINATRLKGYLDSFNSLEDYLKKIYFIEDEKFIKKMIESSKFYLNDYDGIKNYLDLAIEYWDIRRIKFEAIYSA